ncbi:type I restriction-modification enzyme R subunit C-terminal domain-containing protein [Brevundimonas sp.]|uniref:type I restriction-modification enzyme R subunit C-terminal domain-containing protein n=1 Tax=Brevundimonas sp. TaxID=1871086 RepID=UPI003567F5B8
MSERDICSKFITPALTGAGWDLLTQIREEVSFTKGRIIVRGKLVTRGKAKRADYVLYFKPNLPIALIEAKDNKHNVGDGIQQALAYAETIVDRPDITLPEGFGEKQKKVYVDGVAVSVVSERIEYLDANGKLVTESLRDFTRNTLRKRYVSLDAFLRRWNEVDRKQAIIDELADEGLPLEVLSDLAGKNLDPFDLICHVAFDQPPLTRQERADLVRKRDVFTRYGPQARAVLEALLTKYEDEGLLNLDDVQVLKIAPFDRMGTAIQLVKTFGGRPGYEQAVHEMQAALYDQTA